MPKYRKKPVVIEAVQWTGLNVEEVREICGQTVAKMSYIHFNTLEGVMRCDVGDWIIKGIQNELYPCKPDIFAATYEAVDD